MSGKKNKRFSSKVDENFHHKSPSDGNIENIDQLKYNIFSKKSSQMKRRILKKIIESDSESSDEITETNSSDEIAEINSSDEIAETNNSDELNQNKITGVKPAEINKKSIKNSNEIFKELIREQLSDVPTQWKLNINDMKRICKYIDTSIFDKKICCIWNGYITNMNNSNKGTYVNFYFRNKKVALHRLLYSNFVAPLDSSEYLKFNCDNKGICCNINHYEKYKYSKNNSIVKKKSEHKEPKKEIKEITIVGSDDPEKLIIDFD
jgi:hypothetical protein